MKKIEIPELTDFCLSKDLERKILRMGEEGLRFYSLIKDATNWKNKYEILHVENKAASPITLENNYYWITKLKGVKFFTKEEAELYAFLDYCTNEGNSLEFYWGRGEIK